MTGASPGDNHYSRLTRWRSEYGQLFGPVLSLPVVRSPYTVCQRTDSGGRILDVGAGVDKALTKYLKNPMGRYRSLDTDPAGEFDFHSLDEVPRGERFDLIVLNQVVEHISVKGAEELLSGVRKLLSETGVIVASTPNVQHPVRYWGDATHVTPWPADDLYGLFRCAGLTVDHLFRSSKRRLPWNPFSRFLVKSMTRQFGIDWCDTLTVVASGSAHGSMNHVSERKALRQVHGKQ